jgi:hypothetical protein
MQERVIKHLWPSFYDKIITIPRKKYKKLSIDSQYGTECMLGFEENVPNDIREEMLTKYDKHYNFHIDSLSFLDYKDINWAKYFRAFPKPERMIRGLSEYIVSHIISTTSLEHRAPTFYVNRLVLEIDKLCQKHNMNHFIVSTPEINDIYSESLKQTKRTHIFNGEVEKVCDLIIGAKAMIGCDSGWRLVANCVDIPTVVFSKQCSSPGQVPQSHIIRWLPFYENCLPVGFDAVYSVSFLEKQMQSGVYKIFPHIQDIDRELIRRRYKINTEKSIL